MALPETESLWYMAQSPGHRRLLKHPVITSFLWMKWQRIRKDSTEYNSQTFPVRLEHRESKIEKKQLNYFSIMFIMGAHICGMSPPAVNRLGLAILLTIPSREKEEYILPSEYYLSPRLLTEGWGATAGFIYSFEVSKCQIPKNVVLFSTCLSELQETF